MIIFSDIIISHILNFYVNPTIFPHYFFSSSGPVLVNQITLFNLFNLSLVCKKWARVIVPSLSYPPYTINDPADLMILYRLKEKKISLSDIHLTIEHTDIDVERLRSLQDNVTSLWCQEDALANREFLYYNNCSNIELYYDDEILAKEKDFQEISSVLVKKQHERNTVRPLQSLLISLHNPVSIDEAGLLQFINLMKPKEMHFESTICFTFLKNIGYLARAPCLDQLLMDNITVSLVECGDLIKFNQTIKTISMFEISVENVTNYSQIDVSFINNLLERDKVILCFNLFIKFSKCFATLESFNSLFSNNKTLTSFGCNITASATDKLLAPIKNACVRNLSIMSSNHLIFKNSTFDSLKTLMLNDIDFSFTDTFFKSTLIPSSLTNISIHSLAQIYDKKVDYCLLPFFDSCKNLISFSISGYNESRDQEKLFKDLFESINNHRCIEKLTLYLTFIEEKFINQLIKSNHPSLKNLKVRIKEGTKDFSMILDPLVYNTSLQCCQIENFSNHSQGLNPVDFIIDILNKNKSLVSLKLNYQRTSSIGDYDSKQSTVETLVNSIRHNLTLKSLNLPFWFMDNPKIIKAMASNSIICK
ncbi:hypothetical protein CYY_001746 [Polysphondylium violaceum]|uniref:Uncharacterized protein n=1 Tax=Polysphondylium violaceum TaxID=133409 RepID=A0A8J4Q0L4_9MYCE|nr:hypothetical protein CYY_001746 [Polysphondylium violaceum]